MKSSARRKLFTFALICLASWLAPPAAAQAAAPQKVVIADQFGPGHLVTVVIKK